jgi:hypothetical protein
MTSLAKTFILIAKQMVMKLPKGRVKLAWCYIIDFYYDQPLANYKMHVGTVLYPPHEVFRVLADDFMNVCFPGVVLW